jgi:aminoglycoside phosphotransferase family enzyme
MTQDLPLVQSLLSPQAYPEHPGKIEMMQTQMSFIFLTGEHVYKIKKPVNLGYLDYTTLGKRKHFCQQELILNRRLCPNVYLAVIAVTDYNGQYSINGKGNVVEYAVKMLQLPQDRMMDNLIRKKRLSPDMIDRVSQKLAEFHHSAATNQEIAQYGDIEFLKFNTEENFSQTERYIDLSITRKCYDDITAYTRDFIQTSVPLFRERIKKERIRDCHGDLHAAHVCFTDGIQIFDCIEFNDRFRYCDVASEIAFLAMDLDYHRRHDLAQRFVETYMKASGDRGAGELLGFYKCYRAYVRGKVESFKYDDAHITGGERDKALSNAKRYFELAGSYISQDSGNR